MRHPTCEASAICIQVVARSRALPSGQSGRRGDACCRGHSPCAGKHCNRQPNLGQVCTDKSKLAGGRLSHRLTCTQWAGGSSGRQWSCEWSRGWPQRRLCAGPGPAWCSSQRLSLRCLLLAAAGMPAQNCTAPLQTALTLSASAQITDTVVAKLFQCACYTPSRQL